MTTWITTKTEWTWIGQILWDNHSEAILIVTITVTVAIMIKFLFFPSKKDKHSKQ